MAEIKVLPPELQELIAAGEVVERPASVVKELLENSIDAGSTEIIVEIHGAGKKLIRVTDNGSGMSPEDLRICFLPHATSKLSSKDDLFRVTTMGFRGEALSSISAVSKMKITSSLDKSPTGLNIEIKDGKINSEREVPFRGTTVEVRDLFYNTPARRKFLKSDRTENTHIIQTVTEAALSHPSISFHLNIDKRPVLQLNSAGCHRERIQQLFGIELLDELIEINIAPIMAFVSKEGRFRNTRANQYLFINNRPVRDGYLRHAVYSAYEHLLPPGKHPVFFLYLSLPPEEVDFNVHPQKTEVRFKTPSIIYSRVYHCINSALLPKKGRDEKLKIRRTEKKTESTSYQGGFEELSREETFVSEPTSLFGKQIEGPIYIGDVFFAYSDGKGVWIVDQHAAHERIRYEKLKKSQQNNLTHLLFPKQIVLAPAEFNVITDIIGWLNDIVNIEVFGENTLLVRAVPDFLFDTDIKVVLSDIAKLIIEEKKGAPLEELKDSVIKTMACHSSVRGKKRLSKEELLELIRKLEETQDPDHCPHGRPTRLRFSTEELRKLFKRT